MTANTPSSRPLGGGESGVGKEEEVGSGRKNWITRKEGEEEVEGEEKGRIWKRELEDWERKRK